MWITPVEEQKNKKNKNLTTNYLRIFNKHYVTENQHNIISFLENYTPIVRYPRSD